MIDICELSVEELETLCRDIRQRQYELADNVFEEFFQSKDFEYLCKVYSLLTQEKDFEITITVSALVSLSYNKDEARIDVIARDKESLVRDSKMKEALSKDPEIKKMQKTVLKANAIFDEKMHEYIAKYNLHEASASCRIINKINGLKLKRR